MEIWGRTKQHSKGRARTQLRGEAQAEAQGGRGVGSPLIRQLSLWGVKATARLAFGMCQAAAQPPSPCTLLLHQLPHRR